MSDHQTLDALFQQIRDICAEEYKRGEKDAIERIVKAAAGEKPSAPKIVAEKALRAAPKQFTETISPRGLAEKFVRRVMTERPDGISPGDITLHAKTAAERKISYSALRKALKKGRTAGHYSNSGGKWFKTPAA